MAGSLLIIYTFSTGRERQGMSWGQWSWLRSSTPTSRMDARHATFREDWMKRGHISMTALAHSHIFLGLIRQFWGHGRYPTSLGVLGWVERKPISWNLFLAHPEWEKAVSCMIVSLLYHICLKLRLNYVPKWIRTKLFWAHILFSPFLGFWTQSDPTATFSCQWRSAGNWRKTVDGV